MSKVAAVVAIYRLNESELVQMAVPILNSYPDALDQAKNACIEGIREMVEIACAIERTDTE